MAKADLTIVGGAAVTPVLTFLRDDRTTSSESATTKPGEPLKATNVTSATASNFCILIATGDPEIGTDAFIGIAESESTETSTADGDVDVSVMVPFVTRLRGHATTVANIDTQAELNGVKMDSVAFDLASGIFTIDEDEGTDPDVHGLTIVDGDIGDGTLDVYVRPLATLFGNTIAS